MPEEYKDTVTRLLTEIRDELRKLNEKRPRPKREEKKAELPELALLWNEWADPSLPRVTAMEVESSRYKNCKSRWRSNPNTDYWIKVISRLNRSSFCLGKNDRGWKADIEFLVRPDQSARILEGKFDDKTENQKQKRLLGRWVNPDTGLEEDFFA